MNKQESVRKRICQFFEKIRNLEIKLLYNTFWRKEQPDQLYTMQLNVWMMELDQRDAKVQVDRPKKASKTEKTLKTTFWP